MYEFSKRQLRLAANLLVREAKDLARVNINNRRHVNVFPKQFDIRDIGRPHLIAASHLHSTNEIWMNEPFSQGLTLGSHQLLQDRKERIDSHDTSDSLGVHSVALTQEMMPDSSISITRELEMDLLDGCSQLKITRQLELFLDRLSVVGVS